ncbi:MULTISPECIES: hypothetical protein [Chryseobacterium]|uniref:Uncharacterized protein n=1 Tax=Candidatus Chryseobacterium massiliense TaxID=204089 RepID=A0A3D9AHR1_9FLAO|nr:MULTISPECIES: hypothetical protein [Chryseobacterium]REC40894.1 hypothetical protein DRF68_19505 [Candidatus Chryseobacterium massiliae]
MANQINEELNKKIDEVLASVEEQDERKLYDVFKYLCDSKFETKLSPKTIGQIINTVQYGLNRNYGMFRPYRSIYILIGELAPFHSEEIASIQNDITNYLNDDIFDYDEFTSVLYFFREAWKYLESVWSIENKAAIIENLIDIVEDEYESDGYFDAFIADNVLRALIVIEKDDPKAQKTIKWVEKVLEEDDRFEDEDDEENE